MNSHLEEGGCFVLKMATRTCLPAKKITLPTVKLLLW